MRIGLITPGFSASEADWCVPALLDLVRALGERDEVTVFALRYPHRREAYQVHGATIYPTGGAERGGLARLPILLQTLSRILAAAKRRPFDVLQALWAHEPGFVATLAGRLLKTPVLVSILGGELVDLPDIDYGGGRSRVNRWLIARALAGANRVTVGSRRLRDQVACRLSEPIYVQPLGFEPSRFRPDASEQAPLRLDGEVKLLHVASFSPVKDHRLLLAAFSILAERFPAARLHLVGEGVVRRNLSRLLAELDLAERVELHGAVDHGQLADFYRQADLCVQSSRFESQGLAVLEAAACGCPVVGTGVGVVPDLCPADLVAAPGDAESLAGSISSVLADDSRRASLIEAQAEVVRTFELPVVVERLRRHFADLVTPDGENRRQ